MLRYSFSAYALDLRKVALACVMGMLLGPCSAMAQGQPSKKIDVLRIGTSGSLALNASGAKEETALDALKSFIKTETSFENEIIQQTNYEELVQKLMNGQLHLGVFQGFEFAWAQAENAKLQPLALAVVERVRRLDVRRHAEVHDRGPFAERAHGVCGAGWDKDRLAGRAHDGLAIHGELDLALHHEERLAAEVVAVDFRHRPQLDAAKARADLRLDDEVRQVCAVVVHIDRHLAYRTAFRSGRLPWNSLAPDQSATSL